MSEGFAWVLVDAPWHAVTCSGLYPLTQAGSADCAARAMCLLPLPACRWHYVEQVACEEQGWCVAVNYWYDMQFDSRYAAYTMVESLAQQAGLVPGKEAPADDAVKIP